MDEWIKYQNENAKKIILQDSFDVNKSKYIGGVDISFNKNDPSLACGYLTIINIDSCDIVYEDHQNITLSIPYCSGFLGFREVPVYLSLLQKLKQNTPQYYPDVVMIDGFGILHQRGFGSASHLGFITDIPTIGVAKTLLCFEGLDEKIIKTSFKLNCKNKGDCVDLIGTSGKIYGVALKGTLETENPIYVSIGHKISLETSIKIVTKLCKYRVPEPIRNSDIKSKLFL